MDRKGKEGSEATPSPLISPTTSRGTWRRAEWPRIKHYSWEDIFGGEETGDVSGVGAVET